MDMIPAWVKTTVAGVLLVAVFIGGWMVRGWRDSAATNQAVAKQATAVVRVVRSQNAVTAAVDASATAAASHTQIIYRTITKEVIRYVSTHPAACGLPAEWVRLHNAAATGQLPASAGAADAAQ
jgi:hypothetical protein